MYLYIGLRRSANTALWNGGGWVWLLLSWITKNFIILLINLSRWFLHSRWSACDWLIWRSNSTCTYLRRLDRRDSSVFHWVNSPSTRAPHVALTPSWRVCISSSRLVPSIPINLRPVAPRTHRRRHLVCIPARTRPRSEARRRRFVSTTTNTARRRPWLHYDDRRLTVPIVNEVLVAHLVFSFLRMQKAFELQSFENMLQSLQIFGWFFNPSHPQPPLNLSVDRNAPFRLLWEEVRWINETLPLCHSSIRHRSSRLSLHIMIMIPYRSITETVRFFSYYVACILSDHIVRNVITLWIQILIRWPHHLEIEVVSVLEQISGNSRLRRGSPELRFLNRFRIRIL